MVLVVIYFLVMTGLTLYSRGKVSNCEDYFVSGRQLTVWLATPTIVATWFGAGSFLGVSSTVYNGGLGGVIADPFGCTMALLIAGIVFASRFRRQKKITVIEIIRNHYGKGGELATSLLTIPFYIGTLASQILAISVILSAFFGCPPLLGILISFLIILLYTLFGGLWSVTSTDGLQLLILVGSLLALLATYVTDMEVMTKVGAAITDEFTQLLPTKHPEFGYLSYAGMWLMTGLGSLMGQDLVQRFFACKDEKTAQRSTLLSAPLYLFIAMVPVLLGVIGRFVVPEGEEVSSLLPYLVNRQGSELLSSLFIIGVLSVTLGTAETYLLAGSAILAKNVVRIGNREKGGLLKARLVSLAVALLALLLCFITQDIYSLMVHSGVFLFVSLFVPVTAALFLNHVYAKAGTISMVAGVLGWLLSILLYRELIFSDTDNVLYASALVGGCCSLAGFVLPHLFYVLKKKAPLSA